MVVAPYGIGIQLNQEELTETLMLILNWNKPFGLHDLYKIIQRYKS